MYKRQPQEAARQSPADTGRELPPFDRMAALATTGTDETLLAVAGVFAVQAPKLLQQARAALTANDAEGVYRAAHTLNGTASIFSARRTTELAAELERLARAADLAGAPVVLERLAAEVTRLLDALRAAR